MISWVYPGPILGRSQFYCLSSLAIHSSATADDDEKLEAGVADLKAEVSDVEGVDDAGKYVPMTRKKMETTTASTSRH